MYRLLLISYQTFDIPCNELKFADTVLNLIIERGTGKWEFQGKTITYFLLFTYFRFLNFYPDFKILCRQIFIEQLSFVLSLVGRRSCIMFEILFGKITCYLSRLHYLLFVQMTCCLSKLHYLLFVKITWCLSKLLAICQNYLLFVKITLHTVCQRNLLFVKRTCCLHGNLLCVRYLRATVPRHVRNNGLLA